jgi:L-alanine-DL-glutamate epimerase-like enolase superfamily enzyme
MKATFERVSLPLADAFTISRGRQTTADGVIVRVGDGLAGVGAAAPSEYYGETVEDVEALMPELLSLVEDADDPHAIQRLRADLAAAAPEQAAARAAVSAALWDHHARALDAPLYRVLGLDPDAVPPTSYTVSIADPERMRERAAAVADEYEVIKIKLGTDDDRERVRAVRSGAPQTTLRVDANGAWSPEEAIEMSHFLADHDVEFLEQPVPGDDVEGLRRVREAGSVPVAADESCVTAADVPRVADAVDLVVVKLMKVGGVWPALETILAADAHGLDAMLGCMIESNAAIAAAANLAPLVEYVDLDGALLLAEDPCSGIPVRDGRFDLTAIDSGTGARLDSE